MFDGGSMSQNRRGCGCCDDQPPPPPPGRCPGETFDSYRVTCTGFVDCTDNFPYLPTVPQCTRNWSGVNGTYEFAPDGTWDPGTDPPFPFSYLSGPLYGNDCYTPWCEESSLPVHTHPVYGPSIGYAGFLTLNHFKIKGEFICIPDVLNPGDFRLAIQGFQVGFADSAGNFVQSVFGDLVVTDPGTPCSPTRLNVHPCRCMDPGEPTGSPPPGPAGGTFGIKEYGSRVNPQEGDVCIVGEFFDSQAP